MVLISDDDPVMMIKMITMKTIMRIKMMRMKILPLLCRIFVFVCADVKSKYGCWCHLVPYGMLGD